MLIDAKKTHETARGVVCAGHPAVAEAGAEVLERGGNAVDAAVAAFFTAFHAEPMLASAAGGGFLVAEVDGQRVAYDFFASAPGLGRSLRPYSAGPEAFWQVSVDFGSASQSFHIGPGSVAVPGALAGLCRVQRDLGTLTLAEVLDPAISACEGGTMLSAHGAYVLELLDPIVRATPEFEAHLTKQGRALCAGELHCNPDLARFYEGLAAHGDERFLYEGPMARALVEYLSQAGGGLTYEDLSSYRVECTEPLVMPLIGGAVEVLLTPPPSSGGMLIAYGLALLDAAPRVGFASREEVMLLRAVMAETARARVEIVGADTPCRDHAEALLSPAYIAGGLNRLEKALQRGYADLDGPSLEDNRVGNTTHISTIDDAGNACAVTISSGECSGNVMPGAGIFLNNFLGEEDLNPEGFYRFPPGARLGSTMSPVLLVSRRPEGRGIAAMGSGGSNRIRTALLQVIHHIVNNRITTAEAVAADRLHYEDGVLYGEAATTHAQALRSLAGDGVRMSCFDHHSMFFGGVHLAARRHDGAFQGIGDARRSGAARFVHQIASGALKGPTHHGR